VVRIIELNSYAGRTTAYISYYCYWYNNNINIRIDETQKINERNYKLSFSNTLFEEGQQVM
jgi:hypothetical protein